MIDALAPPLRRSLRQRAHGLKPVVLIGAAGVTAGVVAELDRALMHHELVKIRFHEGDRELVAHLLDGLCQALSAHQVQRIGRVAVLYRQAPPEPRRRAQT